MAMVRGKRMRLNMGTDMGMEMSSVTEVIREEGVLGPLGMAMVVVMGRACSERTYLEKTTDPAVAGTT
jgi:hypothetical protein